MKKLKLKFKTLTSILLVLSCFSIISCENDELGSSNNEDEWECGTHNGKQLYTGPKGGCYYYNSNDNKTYVDRSECNCK